MVFIIRMCIGGGAFGLVSTGAYIFRISAIAMKSITRVSLITANRGTIIYSYPFVLSGAVVGGMYEFKLD
jgi:hypothetical protein